MNKFVGRELYSKAMGTNLKRVFMRQYGMMKDHSKIDWTALKKAKYLIGELSLGINVDLRIRCCSDRSSIWASNREGLL